MGSHTEEVSAAFRARNGCEPVGVYNVGSAHAASLRAIALEDWWASTELDVHPAASPGICTTTTTIYLRFRCIRREYVEYDDHGGSGLQCVRWGWVEDPVSETICSG